MRLRYTFLLMVAVLVVGCDKANDITGTNGQGSGSGDPTATPTHAVVPTQNHLTATLTPVRPPIPTPTPDIEGRCQHDPKCFGPN
jgi:hypothetical protein